MQTSPEMNEYNAILGDAYREAVMRCDLPSQLEFLSRAAMFLSQIGRDTKMYGDHHAGFERACDLLDGIRRRIAVVESELMRQYEIAFSNERVAPTREHEVRADWNKEMKQDAFGI